VSEEPKLQVAVSYGGVKAEFSGPPEAVLLSVNRFLSRQIPTLDLAEKISINYSVADLLDMFSNFVKMTPEGPRVWPGEYRLSDKEVICLQLTAAKIGHMSGRLETPSMTLSDIQSSTGLKPKSISSRLSEVSKAGYVEREQTEQGVRYRITTQGVYWLSNVLGRKAGGR